MPNRGKFIGSQDNLFVPDAPTIGTATAGDAQVSVAFTAPSDVGADAITLYGVSAFLAGATINYKVSVGTGTLSTGGSGNVYFIDGIPTKQLSLIKGYTYVFDLSDSSNSGHPFGFKDNGGSSYTTGVTTSGTAGNASATVTLVLATDASEPSRYYCTSHGNGMGNTISLIEASASTDPLGAAQAGATGSSSPVTVTGLTNGTSYTAQAWAINDYGNGPLSSATSSFTPLLPTPGIDFDGTNDYLAKTSDLTGNADGKTFTFSAFFYLDSTADSDNDAIYGSNNSQFQVIAGASSKNISMFGKNSSSGTLLNVTSASNVFALNTWNHVLISMDLANTSNRYMYVNDQNITSGVTFTTYSNGDIDFTRDDHGIAAVAQGGSAFSLFKGRLGGVYLDYTYRDLSTTSNRRLFIDADGLYVTPPTTGILSLNMNTVAGVGTNSGTGGDFTLNGTVAQSGRNALQYNAAASTFDGVNSGDKLVRTSQLTGISDTKTGTIRFSVSSVPDSGTIMSMSTDSSVGPFAYINQATNGTLTLTAKNSSGTTILSAVLTGYGIADKWETHCITWDLSDTSKRAWFVNGVATSPTWSTYTNDTIDYTRAESSVANQYGTGSGASGFAGELSDIWFDNSYTADLSVFYDATTNKPKALGGDGSTPTGSSPLVYLPLRGNDAGNNKGTGGDFTVNSGPYTGARGPSEFWGESADFNGSDQYLHRTSGLTNISDSRFTTVAFSFFNDVTSGSSAIFTGYDSTSNRTAIIVNRNAAKLRFYLQDSSGQILAISDIGVSLNTSSWFNVLISDNRTTQTTRIYINDTAYTPTPAVNTASDVTYGNASFGIGVNEYNGDYSNDSFFNGKIGFFYFTTEFIDFSSEANRLKFFDAFGYPVDLGSNGSTPTGTQPLIYINKGFHNGTNLGSGGNFTPQGTPTDGGYVKG